MNTIQENWKVEIILNNNIYHPGDTVSGTIYFDNKRKLFCQYVEARLKGHVRVFWTERVVGTSSLCENRGHEQKKMLIEKSEVIWKDEKANQTPKNKVSIEDITRMASSNTIRAVNCESASQRPGVEQGRSQMDFSFDLPKEGLLSTFESISSAGCVQYWVEIAAIQDGRTIVTRKVLFAVVVPTDLRQNPEALQPINKNQIFTLGSLGEVHVNIRLPKSGYVTGEMINALVTIYNGTKKSVKYSTMNICQRHFCYATEPIFASMETKFETAGYAMPLYKIKPGETQSYSSEGCFNVPALCPPVVIPEFLIVDYRLQLTLGLKRSARKAAFGTVSIPIFIGTIPVGDAQVSAPPLEDGLRQRNQGKQGNTGNDYPPPPTPSAAPPTYEEIDNCPPPSFDDVSTKKQ